MTKASLVEYIHSDLASVCTYCARHPGAFLVSNNDNNGLVMSNEFFNDSMSGHKL